MKMKIYADNPSGLYNDIKSFIEEESKTWIITSSPPNFPVIYIHDKPQWEKVLLIPTCNEHYIEIETKRWKNEAEPEYEKDPYVLGRFIELLLVNFLGEFNSLTFDK
ncbi:MAG: hypothetical protein JNM21_14940 [Taibaiella sp.]|nr:hypothetical protein [Taibaiella sp.]